MTTARCYNHKDRVTLPTLCPTCQRIAVEQDIVTRTVDALLAAGYWLATDNGGDTYETTITPDRALVLTSMMETDEERLYVWQQHSEPDRPVGWVYFVYGNDGWDVISDYTTNLEAVLASVNAYADCLAP